MDKEKMAEKVSIIVPMHNAARYIKETIDSVAKQTYVNWELLLVDDCSADQTVDVVKQEIAGLPEEVRGQIRLICLEENVGAARARNTALTEAEGRYISYLDADDLWDAAKMEKQILFMQEKDAAFSFTGYEFADENGVGCGKIVKVPEMIGYKQALRNTTIFTSTVMFDTEKIPKNQLEMPVIKSEDSALWFKVLRQGYQAYGLNENLVAYRRGGKTLSSNKLEAVRRIWNLYRRAEKLSLPYSVYNLFFWAVRAVRRRI